jgi:hypothetical protein
MIHKKKQKMISGAISHNRNNKENEKWFLRKIIKKNPVSNSELENDSGGDLLTSVASGKSELGVDYNMPASLCSST